MKHDHPTDPTLDAKYYAQQIVCAAHTAYWMQGRDDVTAEHLKRTVHEEFRALAAALGYTVQPIVAAESMDAWATAQDDRGHAMSDRRAGL